MALSVIVTAYRSAATLRACLERLRNDPDVSQILVADCSEEATELPVAVRRFPAPTEVPVMRWAMLPEVTGEVVACLEGRCVPQAGWGRAILAAHAAHPDAPGIGGAVASDEDATWLDTVVWFCEYAAYAPPLADAPAREISGAHLTYKAAALRERTALLATGAWETQLHIHWHALGQEIRTIPAIVTFRNSMSWSDFARQRFQYGRGYAAARNNGFRRLLYGLMVPALPFLLTFRTAAAAGRAGRMTSFLMCLPGIFFFHTMWSGGELLGYWFGDSGKQHNY